WRDRRDHGSGRGREWQRASRRAARGTHDAGPDRTAGPLLHGAGPQAATGLGGRAAGGAGAGPDDDRRLNRQVPGQVTGTATSLPPSTVRRAPIRTRLGTGTRAPARRASPCAKKPDVRTI